LNILGLATGITCAALILLWVEDEVTFNDFPKKQQLYAVYQNQTYGEATYSFPAAPNPLSAALKEEVPGIKNVMRYSDRNKSIFSLNEKIFYETGIYADASIFGMLDIEFVSGSVSTAFDMAYPLVITEQMANRFFGKDNPVGQNIKKDNSQEYVVTAVVKTPKHNTGFSYSWMIPFKQLVRDEIANGWQDAETSWMANWMYDYVELEASADYRQVNDRIRNMLKEKRNNPDDPVTLFLYPISKLKLYGEFKDGLPTGSGFIRYVRLFFWIALVILAIACINYMNLSTARSQKRVMEIGVRKTFGAKRFQLIRQFLYESGIVTFISLSLAIILIIIALPQFNILTGKQLILDMKNPVHWIGLLCVGLVCSVVAGSFPAFFLSSFPPIDVLRKLKAKNGAGIVRFRQGLVVFQFAVSLTLIICTAFVYLQIHHTKNRSLGMNVEQVIRLEANQDLQNHYEPLKQELLATGFVDNVGLSSQRMLDISNNGGGWNWQGKPDHIDPLVSIVGITDGLFPSLQITLHEGRNFDQGADADSRNIIINQSFAKLMGEEGQVGRQLWQNDNKEYALTIIGIVNDFIYNDMNSITPRPAVFWMGGDRNNLFIRLKPGNMQSSLQKVETVIKQIAPGHPFEYQFMD
jgi:cell division protein FtsX